MSGLEEPTGTFDDEDREPGQHADSAQKKMPAPTLAAGCPLWVVRKPATRPKGALKERKGPRSPIEVSADTHREEDHEPCEQREEQPQENACPHPAPSGGGRWVLPSSASGEAERSP